jgi:hypothetical protein
MLLTTLLLINAPSSPARLGDTDTQSTTRLRGRIVDADCKTPIGGASVEVFMQRPKDRKHGAVFIEPQSLLTAADGSFISGTLAAGPGVLVAHFAGPTTENLVVKRFTIAAGERADLGALHPEGPEHRFRLGIFDRAGVDVTSSAAPAPADEYHTTLIAFDVTHLASLGDPQFRWTFYRARGSTVTFRGFDALRAPVRVQARIDENALLSGGMRVTNALRPEAEIGAGIDESVRLDLVVAPARTVVFDFLVPNDIVPTEDHATGGSKSDAIRVALEGCPIHLAAVDESGNVRVLDPNHDDPIGPGVMLLVPGRYDVYAWCSCNLPSDNVVLRGTAHSQVTVAEGEDVAHFSVALKKGIRVKGRVVLQDGNAKRPDPLFLHVTFRGLVSPRSLRNFDGNEQSLIEFQYKEDGTFELDNLPPGEELALGWPGLEPGNVRAFVVPQTDGSIDDVVLE